MGAFYKVSCYVCLNMQPLTLFNQICKMQAMKKAEMELFLCVKFQLKYVIVLSYIYMVFIPTVFYIIYSKRAWQKPSIHSSIHPVDNRQWQG